MDKNFLACIIALTFVIAATKIQIVKKEELVTLDWL
jgi:hypothetical protein